MRNHQSLLPAIIIFFLFHTHTTLAQGYVWAHNAGGSNSDAGEAIAKDAAGNIYVAGFFGPGNATFGSFTLNGTGDQNLFITKYDHLTGNTLWAKKADGFLFPDGIAINSSGDIFITGFLYG